jgi:pantoate--beta-alanine ligase
MQVLRTKQEAHAEVERLRRSGLRLSLVPTMGALHAGHLSLVRLAAPGCDVVMASIFVNPLQFGPSEDLERYPRDLDGDLRKLEAAGVQLVFAPQAQDMLGSDGLTSVQVERLGDVLCGARRPGHFRGVATIVSKLFHVLQPHVAVFGLKDAQQAILLRRMVRDLDFPVELRYGPIVRAVDGLALSSRNAYLDEAERSEALLLQRSLAEARRLVQQGERRAAEIERTIRDLLQTGDMLHVDYVACVDTLDLQPLQELRGNVLIAVGVQLGDTHLIDNIILAVRHESVQDADIEGRPITTKPNVGSESQG